MYYCSEVLVCCERMGRVEPPGLAPGLVVRFVCVICVSRVSSVCPGSPRSF